MDRVFGVIYLISGSRQEANTHDIAGRVSRSKPLEWLNRRVVYVVYALRFSTVSVRQLTLAFAGRQTDENTCEKVA